MSIPYTLNGVKRLYYPDVYIKSINTIVEVKSAWTLSKGMEDGSIPAKREACLSANYNFVLLVYNGKGQHYEYDFR
jgi:hypothetical protein